MRLPIRLEIKMAGLLLNRSFGKRGNGGQRQGMKFASGAVAPPRAALRPKQAVTSMSQFSRLKKAAVVLKHLPPAASARIFSRLGPGDLKTVFAAIQDLDRSSTQPFFDALDELAREAQRIEGEQLPAQPAPVSATVLSRPEDLTAAADSHFGFLVTRTVDEVQQLLRDEHPRNIALVLANLPPEASATLIRGFEPLQRMAIVRRMCDSSATAEETANLVFALKRRLRKAAPPTGNNPVSHVARMLEHAGPELTQELGGLLHQSASHPSRLAAQLAVEDFEQLGECTSEELRDLFGRVDDSTWASALRHCRASTRKHILAALKPADARRVGRKMLDRSHEVSLPGRAAQRQIVAELSRRRAAQAESQDGQPPAKK
jgi:flagellar motor switch protein FliG